MKKINLAITGCMGRMGQQFIKSAKSDKNFNLVALQKIELSIKKLVALNPNLTLKKHLKIQTL